jgi:acyl-coenzyme A thioesterase 13
MNKALKFLKAQEGKDASLSPSALMRWLNPVLLSAEEGKLLLQYKVRKEWTNPMDVLHGGSTAAIIDDAIGVTTFSLGEDYFFTTINLNVDYFSTAKENDIILAETTIVKKGKQFINAKCVIWNQDKSRMIAQGISNLFKTEIKREL